MAKIGEQIASPEMGWKRFDDRHPAIVYEGTYTFQDYPKGYLSTQSHSTRVNDSISFKFKGNALRIICSTHPNRDNNVQITIDGNPHYYSEYKSTEIPVVLVFEKTGLSNTVHTVEIKKISNNSSFFSLDAVDINEGGYLISQIGQHLPSPEAGWRRYDDKDQNIVYTGSWINDTNASANSVSYNKTGTFTTSPNAAASFKFYGTKLRIIAFMTNTRPDSVNIAIDGTIYTYNPYKATTAPQTLVFEKTGLDLGVHTVAIQAPMLANNKSIDLDAIDIDDTGYLVAPIGKLLAQPEPGWKRYDDTDPTIKYGDSKAVNTADTGHYNSTVSYLTNLGDYYEFDFIGTKFRIISSPGTNRADSVEVSVDGVVLGTYNGYSSPAQYKILVYELQGLSEGRHKVVVTSKSTTTNTQVSLDAIDIDSTGRLLHPDEVTDLKDLQVGKRIRANYIASTNIFGTVSGLGEESKEWLPTRPSTAPNGDFYFIMVDADLKGSKILIADRNIQSGISMDVLNTAGIASGSGLPTTISDYRDTFLVGGGASVSHNSITINGAGGTRTNREINSGKWYWEALVLGSSNTHVGVATSNVSLSNPVGTGTAVRTYAGSGVKWNGSSDSYGSTYTSGDVIGIGLNMDAGTLTFYKNGVSQGEAFTDLKSLGTVYPLFFSGSSSENFKAVFNFGHSPFKYEVPPGYSSLVSTPTHAFTLRLLTGGISQNDKDNEWDKYMTDDRIWNNVNHGSWTSTTDQSNAKARVIRGYNGLTNWTSGTTELTTPGRGLRPVLLIETINHNRFLIQDGTDLKTYTASGWETVGTTPPTDDMFRNKGMLDFAACTPYLKDLIDKSNLKILVSKPKREPTVAHLTGVPVPKIVKMKNDISFLSTAKINSLTLSGTEKGILRIAISTDSGTTWEAKQKNSSWTTIDVNNSIDFKDKAMTIDDFNSIHDWDEKLGQARNLRCAFYFEQLTSAEETSLDSLTMDVDLRDSWDMAMPGVDYKYGYNRNTNLRVLLLSNGDFKINVGSGGSSGSTLSEVDGGTF